MESLIFLGVILGLAAGIFATTYFFKNKSNRQLKEQSVILLEKINQVCKLITVEGEFSEIFTHRDIKSTFFNLVQLEKKALIIIKAKVLIGFDLTKLNIEIVADKKQVKLTKFPAPEILSIETDLEYYDVQKGIINKFSGSDLTNLNKKSKDFIRKKVESSHLIQIARNLASDTISVIKQLIESLGWELVSDKIQDKLKEHRQLKE